MSNSLQQKLGLLAISAVLIGLLWSCAPGGGSDSDQDSPKVLNVDVEGAQDVEIMSTPIVTFSEIIDNASITGTDDGSCIGSIQLSGRETGCVIANLSLSGDTLTISPRDNLSLSTEYSIKLTTDIKDLAGNSLDQDYISTFTTSTPPEVSKFNLAYPNDTDVEITTNLQTEFSEIIDNASITGTNDGSCIGSVQLSGKGSAGCVIVDLSLSGDILTISPADNLSLATEYSLKLTTEINCQ